MDVLIYNFGLYLACFAGALLLSLALTPALRALAVRFGHLDAPTTHVKTHKVATPLLGGVAVAAAFAASLIAIRFLTDFPTGTLRDLRVLLTGGAVMLLLGLIDDLRKPHGLGVKTKFAVQFAVAGFTVFYGIKIDFLQPSYLAAALSVLWIVGVSNAFNIIDIMDGLSASQAALAAAGFLLIALPSESIYVNFASAALCGAALGFLPYNFSRRLKIFMGDSGSLFCGYILAVIAMGTSYTTLNPLGVYAPLFILALPIYDTIFVSVMRLRRGHSPFIGSKDHYALRLEALGFSRRRVVSISALTAAGLAVAAFLVTQVPMEWGALIYFVVGGEFILVSLAIAKIKV
ncbi:MAG: UDP-N-acetylmuramyl pentapeptide phosphotransferase/UDP-N-acetylglucosamine-1-phosphate transferase [Elusimicrobia bacterium]|nr:MAG: UDP-N-acetylmuramyl pentapeptide phosphotransferase/UDP-N-acetylglucosamine-1-phosphate transferase [Elusimicrobiota bacterium]KAF0157333.1 MAG: UDP-N-acetylmuramyl pentapeptide phosphotransferase/UDP-N-acetylglucosamine-1-phosphate transferase [Elusimicrobiota bacterium]